MTAAEDVARPRTEGGMEENRRKAAHDRRREGGRGGGGSYVRERRGREDVRRANSCSKKMMDEIFKRLRYFNWYS